jgi:ADP-ribosyl-[dinitrogen reductase] hydrolase
MIDRDRQRGALIGLAVGDALGAPVEFQPPQSFLTVTDYNYGGPFGLEPGQWTDDTSLALALADSLAKAGWDLDDQMRRYLAWHQNGEYSVTGHCFDIGFTTLNALRRYQQVPDARKSGDPAEHSSGNGSIMRLAPVPIRYADLFPDGIGELGRLAAESSLTTHASPQCQSSCRYMALLLAGLIHGVDRRELLDPGWPPLEALRHAEPLHREVEAGSRRAAYREKEPPEIRGSGYVIQCLEAALVGLPRCSRLQRSRAAGREPGRRLGHHGRRLRATGRRLLGRIGNPADLARAVGTPRPARSGTRRARRRLMKKGTVPFSSGQALANHRQRINDHTGVS